MGLIWGLHFQQKRSSVSILRKKTVCTGLVLRDTGFSRKICGCVQRVAKGRWVR